MENSAPITQLLQNVKLGRKEAMDELMPLIYGELKKLAGSYLRGERTGHTLEPTALVHEAYLRLLGQEQPDYRTRAHFFGVAANVMRQVLVDHARARLAGKRGGGQRKINIDDALNFGVDQDRTLVALDDALKGLAKVDQRKADLVEMRFFGGLTAEASAELLGINVKKAGTEFRSAMAWLHREINASAAPQTEG